MADDFLFDEDEGSTETKQEPKDIELTDEQWDKVKALWNSRSKNNPPTINELIEAAFEKKGLDGRSKEGRAVRKKMAEAGLKALRAGDYVAKGLLGLSEEHREFVRNNCADMSSVEIARVIFKNHSLSNLNQETKSVAAYIKELGTDSFSDPDDVPNSEYKPPRTTDAVLKRINLYRHQQTDRDKLSGKQKKEIEALLGYMNTYRFVHQINTYENSRDRDLFESEFVRCAFDKHDLAEEEVDQYILYCSEVVMGTSISARLEKLRKLLDDAAEDEDKKIALALVAAIEGATNEHNSCINRQNKLLEALKVKRSEKEGKAKDAAASILNLVQLWKEEESRKKLIRYAQYRKDQLVKGINDLKSMDEIMARVMGLTEEEALNG